jgi:hypothetical protein
MHRNTFNPHLRRFIDFETPEGDGGGQGGAPARPAWLPEQFKNEEEFARSYDEQRREMDRLRDQARAQEEQFTTALQTLTAEQERQRTANIDPTTDPLIQAAQRAMEEGDAVALLAVNAEISRRTIREELSAQNGQVTPVLQQMQAVQREQMIELAESQAMQYATAQGLDYARSRQDVVDALREIHGESVLPLQGDIPSYTAAITRGIDIVLARGIIARDQAEADQRREKLGSLTTTPGASGRVATGTPAEKAEWDAIVNARTGGYQETMAAAARRGAGG